jgi:hypothetical protein
VREPRFRHRAAWRLAILLYHRIAEESFDPFNLAVSPLEFEQHLIKLSKKTVLPLTEFALLHTQRKLPRDAIAITFDDGYAYNALVAAPILNTFVTPQPSSSFPMS